ncbi:MAG TPA: serine hydrolase domain-containing protein [Bryobacteraceae bacterium]|nr:serine hydrolase domain-containing protein [Bryobacteraceae bacterium]
MACAGPRTALIVTLFFAFVAPATAAPERGDAAFMSAAEKAVETVEREDGFSGVILVARGDQVLLRKAAGFADGERNVRNTPETKFPIASINKQFTAAAILLLAEDGRLSLGDPISKHYPASPAAWKDITIMHLLTHTSGIEDNYANRPEFRSDKQLFLSVSYQDLIRFAAGQPLAAEPNTRFRYANTNYVLLSAVIEHASGQRYEEFLRSRVLAPLGMNDTGFGSLPGNLPKGYRRSPDGKWESGLPINVSALAGAGALHSTVDDLLRGHRSMMSGTLLSPSSRQGIFADHGHNYGFGWYFQTKFGRRMFWNAGNLTPAGFASVLDYFPDDDVTAVVLTNNTGLTQSKATLAVGDGREVEIGAYAARKLLEQIEQLYFGPTQ